MNKQTFKKRTSNQSSVWRKTQILFCVFCFVSFCEGLKGPSNRVISTKIDESFRWNQAEPQMDCPFPTCRSVPEQSTRLYYSQEKSSPTRLSLALRNGATSDDSDDNLIVEKRIKSVRKIAAITVSLASVSYLLWTNDAVRSFDFRQWLIKNLDYANSFGTAGLICYSFVFALWEILIGVTTPVETAAGMAFGVKRGIIGNACGKMGGAITAFLIGRFILKDFVSKKLENNEMMGLVRDSIQANPIGIALIWRFSFLPEFVKNFGLAVLPLKTIHFITAVFLHGFPFTCLWTFMGAEADMLVRGVVSQPSKTLKLLVSGVYVFGFFISPTLVGLWIKSLQDRQKEKSTK